MAYFISVHADFPSRAGARALRFVSGLTLLLAAACSDMDETSTGPGPYSRSDAAVAEDDETAGDEPVWQDPSQPAQPSGPQAPARNSDAGTGSQDPDDQSSSEPPEDPFAGIRDLFESADGGVNPPPAGDNVWTLNADSAPECPEQPPPIPIIGGACLGIYYACGWTNQHGQVYSCICDWIHWLCL